MSDRTSIIAAVVVDVVASGAVGAKAYPNYRDAVPVAEMPVAYIFGTTEEAEPITAGQYRHIEWNLVVQINVFAVETAAKGIEARLDDLTTLINQQIDSDPTLGGAAKDIHITDRDFEYSAAGKNVTGVGMMKYRVIYESYEA